MEYKNGLMELSMKGIGLKTKPKVKEHSGTQKETFMLVNLRRTKHVGLAFTLMLMEVDMKENGLMMCSKAKERRLG